MDIPNFPVAWGSEELPRKELGCTQKSNDSPWFSVENAMYVEGDQIPTVSIPGFAALHPFRNWGAGYGTYPNFRCSPWIVAGSFWVWNPIKEVWVKTLMPCSKNSLQIHVLFLILA